MFEVFPDNPHDPTADGVRNLRTSFEHVLQQSTPHRMAIQRYDVRDYVSGESAWVERFWSPINFPVFGRGSREITHLVHQVEDVTLAVLLRQWINEECEITREQLEGLELMRQELLQSQSKLEKARRQISLMLQSPGSRQFSLTEIQRQFEIPDELRCWRADDEVAVSGIYEIFHPQGCGLISRRIFLRVGKGFPRCAICRESVLYRLLTRANW